MWIDDVRPAPEGYVWCKSVNEALRFIINHYKSIEEISLDHDAGDYAKDGGDFIVVLNEMERITHSPFWSEAYKKAFMKYKFFIHTANPVGRLNMLAIIERNGWKEIR